MSEPPDPKPTVKMVAQRPASDRSLAEEGMTDYADGLAREDAR
mgnify:CR=1 FL=1